MSQPQPDLKNILQQATVQTLAPKPFLVELGTILEDEFQADLIKTPLEEIDPLTDEEIRVAIREKSFEMVIWGDQTSVDFVARAAGKDEEIWSKLISVPHFAVQTRVANQLEQHGIPAITVPQSDKAIDLVELILRLQQTGYALFPGSVHHMNEISGFFYELGVDYDFWQIYSVSAPEGKAVDELRNLVQRNNPEVVILHSDEMARRYPIAFPEVDLSSVHWIFTSEGVKKTFEDRVDARPIQGTLIEAVTLKELAQQLISELTDS